MKKKIISILLAIIMIICTVTAGTIGAFAEGGTSTECLHENTGIVGAKDATCTVSG